MTEKEEIASTRRTFWIAVFAFACTLLSVAYIANSSWRLEVVQAKALASNSPLPIQSISDLQFSPSGWLTAVVEKRASVAIYRWDSSYKQVKPTAILVDFGQLTGNSGQATLISPFTTGKLPSQQSSPAPAIAGLPYALSEDRSMVAWCWGDTLFAGPLQEPTKFRVKLSPPTPVVSLSFFSMNIVGVIHSGGQFFLEGFPAPVPSHPGMPARGPGRISGKGPFRVVSHFPTGDGFLMKPNSGKLDYSRFRVSAAGTFITASSTGTVATGTDDGMILFNHLLEQPPTSRLVLLPEMGRTQTLAFVDEKTLVAGIDSGSLFLVEDETRATPLPSAPQSVRLVAVDTPRIAMVTSGSIIVAELEKQWFLDDSGRLHIALTFYFLSLIALLRLIVADRRKLRSLGVHSLFRRLFDKLLRSLKGGTAPALPEPAGLKKRDPTPNHPDENSEPPRHVE